jgi:hypothetical protein
VISRVHSNWRDVPAGLGQQRKFLWSNRTRGSFQQPLLACQVITRYGMASELVGWVKSLISNTFVPTAKASRARQAGRAEAAGATGGVLASAGVAEAAAELAIA